MSLLRISLSALMIVPMCFFIGKPPRLIMKKLYIFFLQYFKVNMTLAASTIIVVKNFINKACRHYPD